MKLQLLERFVTRLGKYQSFQLDRKLTGYDRLLLIAQMGQWAVRGLWWRLWLKQATGLLLAGKNVKIRYAHHLQVGKNFIIEDGAEIMALSVDGIVIEDNVTIGAYATIKPSSYYGRNIGVGLHVGSNSNIGRYSYIGCSGKIEIGENVMMGPRVGLFAENHKFEQVDIPMKEQGIERKPIIIEDDCWLASSVTVLAGVTIGCGSIIAAGSVVTNDIPPYSVAAGSPAKVIKRRGVPQ
ncbi:MAG: acyltransferase [Anaerolineales bacterium]|nr:acyltransferase [Anaerolineales bacterium]MCA9977854.1 acyltransferase [Anaerolineales bacterium]